MLQHFVHASRRPRLPRHGATLVEVVVLATLAAILLATFVPVLQRAGNDAKEIQSLKNLQILGEAHACYGADWEGRQFSSSPRLLGTVGGNCVTYQNQIGCPNQVLLGWNASGAMWGYFLGNGGACGQFGYPNSPCTINFSAYIPMPFGGVDAGFGFYRLPGTRGFQEYVGGRYYHPTWFSVLDEAAYALAEQAFDIPIQFPGMIDGGIAFASYVNSPAALYNPGVFRKPSLGGFRHPNQGFPDSYDVPSETQCLHPALKSRMIEHNWLAKPPGPVNPALPGAQPYFFNHGIESKPGTLFFDGSVQRMTMAQAVADDARMLAASGGIDGFWSRDTPLGPDGYFGAAAIDDTRNSFHILTTDGILGRDFASRKTSGPASSPSASGGAR